MNDDDLCKALKRLSYISSPSYISFLYHLLRGDNDPLFEEDFTRLNMFYYSLYQDTPDVIGFKNPMDFVLSLREHTDGLKEFLDFLSIQYSERKPLKNKIDLGYDCVLDLYSRYSRNEILAAFDYWNWSKRPSMREGVIYLPDKKTDLFFVTLKKTEDEYSSTTIYEDYFIDKEQFHWQSQNTTPDTSSVGQRYINHVGMGTQVLLFVREQKMKEGKSVPYVFLGKVSYVKHEGSKPMNIIWKLEKTVPDDVYAEFSVERGAAVDDTEIKNTDESLNNVQEAIPDYHVQEGFYPPISIENLDSSSDLLENNNGGVEFEVKIVKKDVNSLIVFAGNAVATLKKDFLGYTIGTYSSILSQELDLSEKVLATRDSLKNIQHLSLCSFDPTLLRLTNSCTLPTFPLALEMITGCRKDESPTFEKVPPVLLYHYALDKNSQNSGVSEVMEEQESVFDKDAAIHSIYSWDLYLDGITAKKHLDKSVLKYNGSGIPMELCPYFHADLIEPGGKLEIKLQYNGAYYPGHIIKEQMLIDVQTPRSRIFWDSDLGNLIREYFEGQTEDGILNFTRSNIDENEYHLELSTVDVLPPLNNELKSTAKWIQTSDNRVQRLIDKTFRTYHVTTISEDLLSYFDVEKLSWGDEKEIVVLIESNAYQGLISRIDPRKERTRLSFRRKETISAIDTILKNTSDPAFFIIDKVKGQPNTYVLSIQPEDQFSALSRSSKKKIKTISYYEHFIQSLGDIVKNYESLIQKPVDIELCPPYPSKIRVYLYKLGHSKTGRSKDEYKSVLRVSGQNAGQCGNFDFSGVNFVIIAGYNPEKDVFVMWDAYHHHDFALNTNLQIKEYALIEAEIKGFVTTVRKIKGGIMEHITLVSSSNLVEGLMSHYNYHKKELLEMN